LDDETVSSLRADEQNAEPDAAPEVPLPVSRLLVGLMLLGSDELAPGLRRARQAGATPQVEEPSSGDLVRHLALGLLVRGERQAVRGLRTAYYASMGTAGWAVNTLDRWTDNWLVRPVRRPIEARIRRLGEEAVQIIDEGKREEQDSRALAAESVEEIVENLVSQMAESQEVDRLIKELVGHKSASFTASIVENMRTLTVTADDVVEGVLRRLLRRPLRQALPPSPIEGQPQTMYASRRLVKGVADHGG